MRPVDKQKWRVTSGQEETKSEASVQADTEIG